MLQAVKFYFCTDGVFANEPNLQLTTMVLNDKITLE